MAVIRTQVPEGVTITLALSGNEARTLRAVCKRIGGPDFGPRSLFSAIDKALAERDVPDTLPAGWEVPGDRWMYISPIKDL